MSTEPQSSESPDSEIFNEEESIDVDQYELEVEDDEEHDDVDMEAKKHADSGASAVDTDEKHGKKSDAARHRKGSKID